jgi:beta-N-acetylhexosaminidase
VDPVLVAKQGDTYIRGMQDAGFICSGKHFPCHGDVDVDSHYSFPVENHDRERMDEGELVPFRSAIRSGYS